ncbi:Cathepsin L-like proteinase [Amphibalanus amphitrite]|uniref:Cathepsin L-like proteinase n=1 Tax=Amphibalanus amphitrite TaxID=1232801 RepID=A0A6A4WM91_AMPAM|nr:Cathepsin L-like proteinase [Amphibalanus amphitrite]
MPKLFCAICQEWPKKLQRRCFSFPSQPYYRRQWLAACRLAAVPASAGVCEGHFTPADFNDDSEKMTRKRLKTSVVPRINLTSPSEAEGNVEATAGQVDIEEPASRQQAPCCPCRCHAASDASMTPKQKRRKLVTSTPRDSTLHDADDACDYTDYVFVFDSTGDEDHEMPRNNEGKYEKTVRVYNRVRDTCHPRSVKAPKKDPHVRRPLEAAVRLKHRISVEEEVHHEGDPRSPFPYVHRGASERETKEALLASRDAHNRLAGMHPHRLNHALLLVGYGSSGQDFWTLANSWGTSWGARAATCACQRGVNMCGIATMAAYPTGVHLL